MDKTAPLDILLYAHDGRGLGHVSRSVAIGMAVRRLYPDLRILLVTGCCRSQELITPAPVDWLKLPAYKTVVANGRSIGVDGLSNYSDQELGRLRTGHLAQIVELYRPRIILADHSPQGKHKELLPALAALNDGKRPCCLLGMRGIIGAVPQTQSPLACTTFTQYYQGLLWYGDRFVLGDEHLTLLNRRFSTEAEECGYVSRLEELRQLADFIPDDQTPAACTISIPWLGQQARPFLRSLADALRGVDPGHGPVNLFLEAPLVGAAQHLFASLPNCSVMPFGTAYPAALLNSRTAMIFGGYNSIVDVLTARLPALVILRELADDEQRLHLQALAHAMPGRFLVIAEKSCEADSLRHNLRGLLEHAAANASPPAGVRIDGAERVAGRLAAICRRE